MAGEQTRIPCPNCGDFADAGTDNPWRPFCSHRCKLIDLGDWLAEEHRIPDERRDPPWDHDGGKHGETH